MGNRLPEYRMTLSLSVLEHLGVNLYSNVPAVISETVANAWDADATEIRIDIREKEKVIVITDNGCGMTVDDINRKFLTVGYHRREEKGGDKTPKHKRQPMGRKGIGKLSLFSIADQITVYTRKDGQENALRLDGEKIRAQMKGRGDVGAYSPQALEEFDADFPHEHGTRLVIGKLKKRINQVTDKSLCKRLARRFGVRCTNEISIFVNREKIDMSDRDYFGKLKYLFQYDDADYASFCPELRKPVFDRGACRFDDNGSPSKAGKYSIRGWIGLVGRTSDLAAGSEAKAGGQSTLNSISVFAREKLGQADILESFGFNSYFARYVIGEIHADFLEGDENDLATSSRQSYIEDAPSYQALHKFLRKELRAIQDIWDNIKRSEGEERARKLLPQPEFDEWLDGLGQDVRKKARRFFGNINRALLEKEDEKRMFVYGVQAFESLRLKDALDALDNVNVENMQEFLKITAELDDLEASYYYNITRERLEVIHKLQKYVREDLREEFLRDYIFEHLWLLDPSWDRATEPPIMEQTVGDEFKKLDTRLSESEKKGRMDIRYRKTAGAHVIVELKRASVSVTQYKLAEQVEKYRKALEKCLESVADEDRGSEPVTVVCVVGKKPSNWKNLEDERQGRNALRAQHIRVVTYQKLIHDAQLAYARYLESQKKRGKFMQLIEKGLSN